MSTTFKDYYSVLGVSRAATPEEIKKAYRKLAREHHPDLHQAGAARTEHERRFKEINEAHEVLSNPDTRKRYDALGEHWKHGEPFDPRRGGGGRAQGPFGGAPGGFGGHGPDVRFEGMGGDFSDFFDMLFGSQRKPGAGRGGARGGGGRAGGGGAGPRVAPKGEDVEAEVVVTLEEVLAGGQRVLSLQTSEGTHEVPVRIPVGVKTGGTLRLRGKGAPGPFGGPPGDLVLRVKVAPHAVFQQDGDDLTVDVTLWPWQAVLGGEVQVPVLEGGAVTLKVKAGAHAGLRLRLRGKGLARRDGTRGDLHARVRIDVPKHATDDERALYTQLQALHTPPKAD